MEAQTDSLLSPITTAADRSDSTTMLVSESARNLQSVRVDPQLAVCPSRRPATCSLSESARNLQSVRVGPQLAHLEPWVTVISHVISHNCDIICDIELYHVI